MGCNSIGFSGLFSPYFFLKALFSAYIVIVIVFLDYIKRVTALQASLDYQSQPTTGKSPKKSPEESSYRRNHGRVIVSVIAKSMTKSKATASLELSGSSQSCSIILSLYSGVGSSSRAAPPTEHPPEPQKTAQASLV